MDAPPDMERLSSRRPGTEHTETKHTEKMKKKPIRPQAYKRYIENMCDMLRRYFYFHEWSYSICFKVEIESNSSRDRNANASIHVDETYLNFNIYVSDEFILDAWRDKDYDFIADCLTHEFSHVLTEPLYSIAINAVSNQTKDNLEKVREQQTERIAGIVRSHMPKDWYLPGKLLK
jgi:hypothetical protein